MSEILGQILPASAFGKMLTELARKSDTIVEIGTWHGEGSTRCIANGLVKPTQRFFTIEQDPAVSAAAKARYQDPRISFIALHAIDAFKQGLLPEKIDLLLLDGDDFQTDEEFDLLHSRARVIALDDTRMRKNRRQRELLKAWGWVCIADEQEDRNGWAVFERAPFEPIGKWNYTQDTMQGAYGYEESYKKAAVFLDDCVTVEDWGCGMAWAKQFFCKARYVGVDGTKSRWCDEVDDLRTRKSSPEGILLRHVLEHNLNWKRLLENATRSACKKLCVVIFTDFTEGEIVHWDVQGIPTLNLVERELVELFQAWDVTTEKLAHEDSSREVIFYCTKK